MSRSRERHDTKIYYSISEASAIAKVKPHVLRYWETQFKMLRPKKNKAGNRMYRKRDLKLIQIIKELLYEKGYTIAGAKRKLLDERAALKDQLELSFTEVDRSALLLEIVRDVRGLLEELKGERVEPPAAAAPEPRPRRRAAPVAVEAESGDDDLEELEEDSEAEGSFVLLEPTESDDEDDRPVQSAGQRPKPEL